MTRRVRRSPRYRREHLAVWRMTTGDLVRFLARKSSGPRGSNITPSSLQVIPPSIMKVASAASNNWRIRSEMLQTGQERWAVQTPDLTVILLNTASISRKENKTRSYCKTQSLSSNSMQTTSSSSPSPRRMSRARMKSSMSPRFKPSSLRCILLRTTAPCSPTLSRASWNLTQHRQQTSLITSWWKRRSRRGTWIMLKPSCSTLATSSRVRMNPVLSSAFPRHPVTSRAVCRDPATCSPIIYRVPSPQSIPTTSRTNSEEETKWTSRCCPRSRWSNWSLLKGWVGTRQRTSCPTADSTPQACWPSHRDLAPTTQVSSKQCLPKNLPGNLPI